MVMVKYDMKLTILFVSLGMIVAGCEEPKAESEVFSVPPATQPMVTLMDPKDILFTTSTLNDALPVDVGPDTPGDDCYQLHEDSWRQFEFVDGTFKDEMASELSAIDTIWKEHAVPIQDVGTAFRQVHVRKKIPKPIDIRMSVGELETLLGGKASPFTMMGYGGVLRDVHAIRLENVVVYARVDSRRMVTLGIEPEGHFTITGDTGDRLERFLVENDLQLVHWPSRTLFDTPRSAMEYLRGTKE